MLNPMINRDNFEAPSTLLDKVTFLTVCKNMFSKGRDLQDDFTERTVGQNGAIIPVMRDQRVFVKGVIVLVAENAHVICLAIRLQGYAWRWYWHRLDRLAWFGGTFRNRSLAWLPNDSRGRHGASRRFRGVI